MKDQDDNDRCCEDRENNIDIWEDEREITV